MSGILQQRLPGFIERLPIGPKGKLLRYWNEYLYDFNNSSLIIFVRILARRYYSKEVNVVTPAPNSRLQVSEKLLSSQARHLLQGFMWRSGLPVESNLKGGGIATSQHTLLQFVNFSKKTSKFLQLRNRSSEVKIGLLVLAYLFYPSQNSTFKMSATSLVFSSLLSLPSTNPHEHK